MPFVLSQVTRNVVDLFQTLRDELQGGFLLFGSPLDILVGAADILITAFGIYYVLKILSDSRAWQLLKGLLLIFVFTQVFGLLGFRTVSFIMANSISVLTFGLVVLFQPELRRTLESVGRNSFRMFSNVTGEGGQQINSVHNLIESIAVACEKMAETYTGALIIIERKTALGELMNGETTITLDSNLTATALQQIFYKGSPLHDGAVLIRQGRILAARVHVPLSDNYHLRKDYGTRHRAAVGASEIGDAIGIAVSEERGAISVTAGGRLYNMENADALRAVLHRLLEPQEEGAKEGKVGIRQRIKGIFLGRDTNQDPINDLPETANKAYAEEDRRQTRRYILLRIGSLIAAIFIWFYVQVVTNPIRTRTYTVPLQTLNVEHLWAQNLSYQKSENTVSVVIRARQNNIDSIEASQIDASIDFGTLESGTALVNMEVLISLDGVSEYTYEIVSRNPSSIPVLISEVDEGQPEGGNDPLPER